MKKSLCLILSAAVIALTLCSCSIIKDKDVLKDYQYTDANGNTYQYATDADGNIVTKEDGGKENDGKSPGKEDGSKENGGEKDHGKKDCRQDHGEEDDENIL